MENKLSPHWELVKTIGLDRIQSILIYGSLLSSGVLLPMCGVLHSVLLLGVGCLPAPGLRSLRCYLQYLSSSHSISQSLSPTVTIFQLSSKVPLPECLPRITHVPENGFSLHASCRHPILPDGCIPWPPPCAPRSVSSAQFCCGHGGLWCHDISSRKSYLWVWSLLKRIPQLCDTQTMMPSVWLHWTSICLARTAKRAHFLQLSFLIGVSAKCLRQKTQT